MNNKKISQEFNIKRCLTKNERVDYIGSDQLLVIFFHHSIMKNYKIII